MCWSQTEASTTTLSPIAVPTETLLAALDLLKVINCFCQSHAPCKTQRCSCSSANMPCTLLCVWHGTLLAPTFMNINVEERWVIMDFNKTVNQLLTIMQIILVNLYTCNVSHITSLLDTKIIFQNELVEKLYYFFRIICYLGSHIGFLSDIRIWAKLNVSSSIGFLVPQTYSWATKLSELVEKLYPFSKLSAIVGGHLGFLNFPKGDT